MAHKKSVADNLGLLLNPVSMQWATGRKRVTIPAEGMPSEQEIEPAAYLCLPDVSHLMQKVALPIERRRGKVIAIDRVFGVKMHVPTGSHHPVAGLERKPFPPSECNQVTIDGRPEHAADKGDFAFGEWPFATRRASRPIQN